jgi:preprotein translocase subunit SecE
MVTEPVSKDDAKDLRDESPKGRNPFSRVVLFVRQVIAELKRVVWPTREEWRSYSYVVAGFVLVIIGLVTLLDLGFGKIVEKVFGG